MAKRDSHDINSSRARQHTLVVFVSVSIAILLIRLFSLQVVQHEEYALKAEANQLQRERVVAPRGFIRDRHGAILVDNLLNFEIVLPWRTREDVIVVAARLAAALPVDTAKVMSRFDRWVRKNGRLAFPLVPDADKFMISYVRENGHLYPNLRVKSRPRRRYRGGTLAAHLLGYVGEASDVDVSRDNGARYFPGDMVGKSALERYYEDEMRGVDGQRVLEVNASGTVMGEVKDLSIPPDPGNDIILTLDETYQQILEKLLGVRGLPAAAVVMNVNDGGIIAAASIPNYEPNEFATGISQSSLDALLQAKQKPLFNRITQARYPPGSTFKMVSSYAVLVNRLVNVDEPLVYCTGGAQFGNRYFRCWYAPGHGWMNLSNAIIQSCDVYFYKIAEIMDVDMLADAARDFGLGERTGIDLPGEVQGLVPNRQYYDKKFGKGGWTQGQMLNNIIGQGEYLTTVLQVVRMCAAIGNGGFLVQPHLIHRIGRNAPIAYPRKRVPALTGRTLRYLQSALAGVISHPDGTANWTRLEWLPVAGKTGTSQNSHGEDHAWFVAYAPAEDPEIAIAVIVENAGHGGTVAAPIARDFFFEYFADAYGIDRNPQAVSSGSGDQVAREVPAVSAQDATTDAANDTSNDVPTATPALEDSP